MSAKNRKTKVPPTRLTVEPVQRAKKSTSKQPRFEAIKPGSFYLSTMQWVKSFCEDEPVYNVQSMKRDAWLAEVWKLEPHLAGVIHAVSSIDTNRGWTLEGGRNQVIRYTDIIHGWTAAPGIVGWRPGISTASQAFYTSDLGAIIELGRDGEQGPVRGLYHVDPTRCYLNGSIETPLTYTPASSPAMEAGDTQSWRVSDYMRMCSMISTRELMQGLGYCAVSRCIEFAKLMVAVYEHDKEELGAQAPRGLLLLQGITEQQWLDAQTTRKQNLKKDDLAYFDAVSVLATVGGDAIDAKLIALSNLPSGFDLQQFVSLLMYAYALGFGYDPSEFYPVQFGALGRGTEMEVQHEKATGKGGLNFIFAFQEQLQRPDILPPTLSFEFEQRDEQAKIEEANAQKAWGDLYRSLREAGSFDLLGGVSRQEFRMLLADQNIIPKEWTEVEEEVETTDEEPYPETGTGTPESVLGVEPTNTAPVSTPTNTPSTPIAQFRPNYSAIQKRILRDRLLSKPQTWLTIERFPKEDIIQYHYPTRTIEVLWERVETLLRPLTYPVVLPPFSSRLKPKKRQDDVYPPGQLCPYCTADLALPDVGWYQCGYCGGIFYADDTDSDYEDYHAIPLEKMNEQPPAIVPIAEVLQPPLYPEDAELPKAPPALVPAEPALRSGLTRLRYIRSKGGVTDATSNPFERFRERVIQKTNL